MCWPTIYPILFSWRHTPGHEKVALSGAKAVFVVIMQHMQLFVVFVLKTVAIFFRGVTIPLHFM